MSLIKSVALTEFSFDVPNIGLETAAAGVGNMAFVPGSTFTAKRWAVRLYDGDGVMGGYVTNWVGTPAAFGQASMLAPLLVGRDPAEREAIYNDLKWELRAYDHMGHGPLDIALWDLVGRQHDVSIKTLLGGFRDKLPTYASTYGGQLGPGGLNSPAAYADYAESCTDRGFHGFKGFAAHHHWLAQGGIDEVFHVIWQAPGQRIVPANHPIAYTPSLWPCSSLRHPGSGSGRRTALPCRP